MIIIPTFPSWARAAAINNFTSYINKFYRNWTFLLLHTGCTEFFDIRYTLIAFYGNTAWSNAAFIFEFSSSVYKAFMIADSGVLLLNCLCYLISFIVNWGSISRDFPQDVSILTTIFISLLAFTVPISVTSMSRLVFTLIRRLHDKLPEACIMEIFLKKHVVFDLLFCGSRSKLP